MQFYVDYLAVDQKSLDYTLEGFFRVKWNDTRLAYNSSEGACVSALLFPDASQIWKPDLYFEKAASVSLEAAGNGQSLSVSPSGEVIWSRQSRVKLRCKMHFGNIPFDTQRCDYILGLYSQNKADVVLQWYADTMDPTNQNYGKGIDNLEPTAVWTVSLDAADQINLEQTYSVGTFTYAKATLTFKRRAQGYVISYIILTLFFVSMSYCGFFINPAATPGRVALAVITVVQRAGVAPPRCQSPLRMPLRPLSAPHHKNSPFDVRPKSRAWQLIVSGLQAAAKNQLPPFAYNTWLTDFMFISLVFNMVGFFESMPPPDQHLPKLTHPAHELSWLWCLLVAVVAVNFGMTVNAKCEKQEEAAKAAAKKQAGQQLVSMPADGLALTKIPGADGGDPDSEAEAGGKTIGFSPFTGLMPRPQNSFRATLVKAIRACKDLDATMRWAFPLVYFIFVMVMISQIGCYVPAKDA